MSSPAIVLATAGSVLLFCNFFLPARYYYGEPITMWRVFRLVGDSPIGLAVAGGPLAAGLGMLAIVLFGRATGTGVSRSGGLATLALSAFAGAAPLLQILNDKRGTLGLLGILAACVIAALASLSLLLPSATRRVERGASDAATGTPAPMLSADRLHPVAAPPEPWVDSLKAFALQGLRVAETTARDFDARYVGKLLSERLQLRRPALIATGILGSIIAVAGGYKVSGDASVVMIMAFLPFAAVLLIPFRICAPKQPTT